MTKGFFLTCAIDYPNAALHMGHIYEKTLADIIVRVHRLNGEKVLFTVGTDEHGEKIAKAAEAAGKDPQSYVDEMSASFQQLMDLASISYDRFVRTTDQDHLAASQHFFSQLEKNGDIYKGEYEGWYCVSDETFWTEKDAVEKNGKKFCPNTHCGKELQRVKEESYFFKWSKFQKPLEEWYAKHAENVFPEFRKKEMAQFMQNGLKDISFSRKSLKWGVPVPSDPSHVMYVWSDALVNYLTVCGYPNEKYKDFWPADIHMVGMDINRFHSLLWPAMLLSAKVELPKQVLVHGFVNDENGQKMSKSIGNVIDPLKMIETHGIEPLRYYLVREVPIGNDLSFSEKNLMERTNAELADGLGNLVYRVLSMLEKYTQTTIPKVKLDEKILAEAETHSAAAYHAYLNHDLQSALMHAWKLVYLGNQSIASQEPWKKMKEGKREEVEVLLATEVELLRRLSILIQPVLPKTSEAMCAQFPFPAPTFASLQTTLDLGGKATHKGAVLFTKRETKEN